MQTLKMIAGLGNPGPQYSLTRHNAGFLLIDQLAKKLQVSWRHNKKDQYLWAEVNLSSTKLVLLKPQAFMNQSGEVLKKALSKFPGFNLANLWVAHDDLDITLGEVKIQFAKGPKIHNGLLSIYQTLGKDFWHIRLGVDNRNGLRIEAGSEYVLGVLSQDEQTLLQQSLPLFIVELEKSGLALS